MSEVDSIGTAYYYSGLQKAANANIKNQKTQKSNNPKKATFSNFLKQETKEPEFKTFGLPQEIRQMSMEDAAIFLKDAVDLAGNELQKNLNKANIEAFKLKVSQFISFMVQNNYEVTSKASKRPAFVNQQNFFSPFNVGVKKKDPRVQINIINEKLDMLTKETLHMQMDNLKILQQADEIKGLIVDLLSY